MKTQQQITKKHVQRVFGGHTFICLRPGCWETEDKQLGIYQMLAGTIHEQWEVFKADPDGRWPDDPLSGDMIGCGFTMAEAVCDTFDVEWETVRRKHGIAGEKHGQRKVPAME